MGWVDGMAQWAAGLRPGHVPAEVLRTAALQHVSTAASLHAAGAGVRPGADEAALAALAEGLSAHEYEDYAFFGHPTHGSVLAAWVAGGPTHVGLLATVAANEVAGRVGAWTLLQRAPGAARVYVPAVAALVARAVLQGAEAASLARALEGLLAGAEVLSRATLHDRGARARALSAAVVAGWRALDQEGHPGPIQPTRAPGEVDCVALLPRVTSSLGHSWYTLALVHRLIPACPALQAPLGAWREVLGRYRAASGHDLDPASVAGVQVGIDHAAWSLARHDLAPGPYSLPWMVATLALPPGTSPAATADLARRVEVRPSPRLTASWARSAARRVRALRRSGPQDTRQLATARPATLVLHTTAGGHWHADQRDAPVATEAEAVVSKFARHAPGSDPGARARLFLDLPPPMLGDALELLS